MEVARGKPHADRVTWVHGDATHRPSRWVLADVRADIADIAATSVTDAPWGTPVVAPLRTGAAAARPASR